MSLTRVGGADGSTGGTDLNLDWGTSVGGSPPAAGDVVLLWWNGQSGLTWGGEIAAFALREAVVADSGSHEGRFYFRVCTGTEIPDGTLTLTQSVANKQTGFFEVWRGADQAAPISDHAVRDESTAGTSHACPQVTTVTADEAIISAIQERVSDSSTNYTPPTGYTKRQQPAPIGGPGSTSSAVADDGGAVSRPAGTNVTPGPWTNGVSTANALTWTVALRPAVTGINAELGRVTGTGTAQPLDAAREVGIGRVTGTGAAQPVTTALLNVLNRVTSTGIARPLETFTAPSGQALFPALSIQAAFMVGASTGLQLTLDDPTRGRLDIGTLGDGSEADPTWVELGDRATEGQGTITRGSQRVDSPMVTYEPGTLSVPLSNRDRALDPSNLDGPYTEDSGDLSGEVIVLTDGGFEPGSGDWNTHGGTLTLDSEHVHEGAVAAKFVPDGSTQYPFAASEWVGFTPGQTFQASAWLWCGEEVTVFTALHWYDAAGVFISETAANWTVPAGSWTRVQVRGIAPSGAAQGPMLVTLAGTPPSSRIVWIDDAELAHLPYAPQTQVTAMRAVRARATWADVVYELMQGTADMWDVSYEDPDQSITVLSATDAMKVLSGISLPAVPAVGDGELSGARIGRILDAAGWESRARIVDAGDTFVQETTLEGEVLSQLRLVADTEIGELHVDGGGRVVFRARNALLTEARSSTPQGVFGDAAGELPYKDLGVSTDDATFFNEVRVTRAARATGEGEEPDEPVEQVADDTGSQVRFYKRTFTPGTAPILDADDDARIYAQWLLAVASQPELRFTELTIEPAQAPADLWPQALGRQLGDRITIRRRPPGGGLIEMDCFIRGITHEFGGEEWTTKWALQSATRYGGFLVLDDVLLGRLDENRLAY